MFRYQQQTPVWRTPLTDPIQWGSGFVIAGQQPGINISRVKFIPIPMNWYTTTGGKLLTYEHPVPYSAP